MAPDAVRVDSLTKILRGRKVLDRVDLTVGAGQVLGLAGANGSGKSTLFKVLLGLVRATSGSATVFGEPVGPGAAVLSRVGALVDGPGFLPYLTGRKNLELARLSAGRQVSPADLQLALDSSGLDGFLDLPYRTYSHGMRYRLGLAAALMGAPDLILLDEPTTGLDPGHVEEIVAAITTHVSGGATILLSSHDLGFVGRVCSHVAFLHEGRVVAAGGVGELIAAAGSLENAYPRPIRL